jgi:hypothetical protein
MTMNTHGTQKKIQKKELASLTRAALLNLARIGKAIWTVVILAGGMGTTVV